MYNSIVIGFFCCLFGIQSQGQESRTQEQKPRLLLCVDAQASFSAQELAQHTSATYIETETRNPFKALVPVCLDHAFVVITFSDQTAKEKKIKRLANRCGYRYLHFVHETLDEAIAKTKAVYATTPRYSSQIFHIPLDESKSLYALLEKVDRLFRQHEITYWAGRNTLLGAVRHKGAIPWEDYHVLHMFQSDEAKFLSLKTHFNNAGLEIHQYWKDFYKIFEKKGQYICNREKPNEFLPFRYPVIDVCMMSLECRQEADDMYVHSSHNFYWHWTDERYSYEQIQQIHRLPFGPLTIPVPGSPECSLNRMYGKPQNPELWKTHAIEPFWNHKYEKDHDWKGNALVRIDDFSPAPWE